MFKKCSSCGKEWGERQSFIEDPGIVLNGYQFSYEELREGIFLFTHVIPTCGTTLAIPANQFLDLYAGEIFEERKTYTDECPAHCFNSSHLGRCPNKCECAYVREVMQILLKK
jgi:hypothetical protein